MAVAAGVTAALTVALKEAKNGLQHKNPARENIMQVEGSVRETFKIRVETPEVLAFNIKKSGDVSITLIRTGAFTAHVEGVLTHIDSSGNKVYQRSYRSDKGGYSQNHCLGKGDAVVITMEAHHFVSAVVGQGSSEMEIILQYA